MSDFDFEQSTGPHGPPTGPPTEELAASGVPTGPALGPIEDAGADADAAEPPGGGRGIPIWAVILVVLLIPAAVAAAILLTRDDDNSDAKRSSDTTLPILQTGAITGPGGQELRNLLAKGRAATFHATYKATTSDPAVEGTEQTFEVWRKAGRLRTDTFIVAGDREARTASFLDKSSVILCTSLDKGDWNCSTSSSQGVNPDGLIGAMVEQLAGTSVSVRDDTVQGRKVKCFVTSGGDDENAELCATAEGVPVVVRTESTRLELTKLETAVDDSVFTPPAKPVGTP